MASEVSFDIFVQEYIILSDFTLSSVWFSQKYLIFCVFWTWWAQPISDGLDSSVRVPNLFKVESDYPVSFGQLLPKEAPISRKW